MIHCSRKVWGVDWPARVRCMYTVVYGFDQLIRIVADEVPARQLKAVESFPALLLHPSA